MNINHQKLIKELLKINKKLKKHRICLYKVVPVGYRDDKNKLKQDYIVDSHGHLQLVTSCNELS